jgi:hypothetical protein
MPALLVLTAFSRWAREGTAAERLSRVSQTSQNFPSRSMVNRGALARTMVSKRLAPEEVPVQPQEELDVMRSAPRCYETVRAALRYRGATGLCSRTRARATATTVIER